MPAKSGKPSRRRWVRFGLALACLALVGGELARRAITGHGLLHRLALAAYHRYKANRMEQARSAYGLPERAEESLSLYEDALAPGWDDWSWAPHDLVSTAHVFSGSHAISMTPTEYKGIYLHHAPFGTAGYGTLQFYIFGEAALNVGVVDANGVFGKQVRLDAYRSTPANAPAGWKLVRIPLTDLGLSHLGDPVSGFVIQAATATPQANIALDSLSLQPDLSLPTAPTEATVALTVDAAADRHPISPYIYGMAFAPYDYLTDLRLGSNRWGGNDKSRYNWVHGNADNAARDWNWANRIANGDGNPPPGPSSSADNFFRHNRAANTATILTVPTLGWVARDTDNGHASQNVPGAGGAPLSTPDGPIAGYDPTINRMRTSLPSAAHRPTSSPLSPSPNAETIYQDEWVRHLVTQFGHAEQGGVAFYAMDNEPDLWDFTHTDVHPARMGYDAMLANFLEYATAVKDVDPSAQITGPVISGWTSLTYSALDRGTDNFHTHADCTQHGGEAFILWFLKQVQAHDLRVHRRSLDVLDVHYYPQGTGLYGSGVDRDAQVRRLRATRSLWDPTYTDESWIGEPIRLIPRLKEWIAAGYPGTKLGITEWNFGADQHINGAMAIAETLGIFGREDVYLADYWAYPAKNSPGYLAFRLFRNADGQGHGFGDLSCRATSADRERVSCFAAVDSQSGDLTLLLINKMHRATVTAPITCSGLKTPGPIMRWGISAEKPGVISPLPGLSPHGNVLTVSLDPESIQLIRIRSR